jgi:hypothetical protein
LKYFNLTTIKKALYRIYEGNTHEHRTSSASSGLLHNYFPIEKFIITPEQTQIISGRRPDYSVEKFENNELVFHLFVEVKSLINSNFSLILDQLHDTILTAVDYTGGSFAVFVVAMKGSKIAFFQFCSYVSLLDEYGITHYNGFIPLNYRIPYEIFQSINNTSNLVDYLSYIQRYNLITQEDALIRLGVEGTKNLPFPHIWDLLNKDHENHVHDLFLHVANNKPGLDIVD